MNSFKRIALRASLVALLAAAMGAWLPMNALADVVYSVTPGSNGADSNISLENHVIQQIGYGSWAQIGSYTGVTIQAVLADGSNENATGTAYLSTSIGSGATALFTDPFSFPNSGQATLTLFSGLSLGPGTYYLVLAANFDNLDTAWLSSTNAVITMASGVSGNGFGVAGFANVDSGDPPASTWTALNENLLFSVTGTQSGATPEPPALILLGSGLMSLAFFLRRR